MEIIDNEIPPPRPAPVFDLDVNANGSLDDAVDLVANYLPGYEGTTQKVSTGTSFNTDVYQGQRTKLILDGIGSDTSEVKRVEFEIIDVTDHAGYASNRSFTTNVGTDDYSFSADADNRSYTIMPGDSEIILPGGYEGGHMDATKTWINFYAKDYGGWAKIEARIYTDDAPGSRTVCVFQLTVPKDTDNDYLADKWEIAMADRWSGQYSIDGIPDIYKLTLFDATPSWPFPGYGYRIEGSRGGILNEQGETTPTSPPKGRGDGPRSWKSTGAIFSTAAGWMVPETMGSPVGTSASTQPGRRYWLKSIGLRH